MTVLQELAAKAAVKAKAAVPLKYGDTITLMDVYNEYILCSLGGRLRTGGFKGGDDQVQIVAAGVLRARVPWFLL